MFPIPISSTNIPEHCGLPVGELVIKRGCLWPVRSTQSNGEPIKVSGQLLVRAVDVVGVPGAMEHGDGHGPQVWRSRKTSGGEEAPELCTSALD